MKLLSVFLILLTISFSAKTDSLPVLLVVDVPADGAFGRMGFVQNPVLNLPHCQVSVIGSPNSRDGQGAIYVSSRNPDCQFIRVDGQTTSTYNYNQHGVSPGQGAGASIYAKNGEKLTIEIANLNSTVIDKFIVQF